jgi:hypothetical protein
MLKKVERFAFIFMLLKKNTIFEHTKKQMTMKISNSTLTAAEIRSMNLQETDVMGFDFQWENGLENNYLTINSKRIVSFTNPRERRKSFDKIKRMGFALGWKAPLLTDEEQGIIQAGKNRENPFAYSIICSNPKMNKVVR